MKSVLYIVGFLLFFMVIGFLGSSRPRMFTVFWTAAPILVIFAYAYGRSLERDKYEEEERKHEQSQR